MDEVLGACRPVLSRLAEREGESDWLLRRTGSSWFFPLAATIALVATFVSEHAYWQILLAGAALAAVHCLPWLRRLSASRQSESSAAPGSRHRRTGDGRGTCSFSSRRQPAPSGRKPAVPKPELRQDSKVPVRAPTFQAGSFSEQVSELLQQITPNVESERLAKQLAECARDAIRKVFPEAEVQGFASGDVARGTAFGVAVPELDIVASASPHFLVQHLQGRLSKGGLSMAKLDTRKLQKSAIRVCTDYLVSEGGFKFRRSAFRGQEPKVTLMAPSCHVANGKRIAVDFSVNSMTPLYNAALVAECGRIDARAKSLILLVRRWAKDRGVCHAAKGHLAPYAWTLLAIYFLQVGAEQQPVLPPLQGFKMASGLAVRRGGESPGSGRGKPAEDATAKAPVSELFTQFVRFYAREIDWHKEAVSVRLGRRQSANLHLMLHIIVQEDGCTEVGPSIEDPFEPARNLGMSTTSVGITRLREEFSRAQELVGRGATLSEILEPWAPAERAQEGSDDAGGDREEDETGTLSPNEPLSAVPRAAHQ